MSRKNIFQFSEYKDFLRNLENERRPHLRGFRSRLAESAGCNNAFVSQVLNTSANFSLEQGMGIAEFLGLKTEEKKYFVYLLELGRAGNRQVQDHFKDLISDMQEKYLNIKERVRQEAGLSKEAQTTYYSQWYFAAVHMIVTIPHLRTISGMANALKLKPALVKKAVDFLLSENLIIETSGEFYPGPSYLHLEKSSPNISKHHSNWRINAIQSLQDEKKEDVHYSTVSTLSKKDAEILRARLVQIIQEYVELLNGSSEETMYCFNLDFFKLIDD